MNKAASFGIHAFVFVDKPGVKNYLPKDRDRREEERILVMARNAMMKRAIPPMIPVNHRQLIL